MGLFPSTARENNFAFPLPVQTRGIIFFSALPPLNAPLMVIR